MQNTSTNASKVELSIKSNALHMKIFPKASFGNSHALTDFNLLKIWRLIMLAHIHLKPEPYHKASFWYFLLFQMWSMHLQNEFAGSFEESYHLHSCIKIWIIPNGQYFNNFVCEFCTKTFGFGERMRNHIVVWNLNHPPRSFEELYLLKSCINIWIIPKIKFWYFKWFYVWVLH